MRVACLVALSAMCVGIGCGPAAAREGFGGLDGLIAAKRGCQKEFEANSRDLARNQAIVRKIPETSYAALCRHGRNVGYPIFAHNADRIRNNPYCRQDPENAGLAESLDKLAEGYRKIVERDCQKAGM